MPVTHSNDHQQQDCLPYDSKGFAEAMQRLAENPMVAKFVSSYFPNLDLDSFLNMARKISEVDAFQSQIISPAIASVLLQTSAGLTISGLDHIDPSQKYVFLSNHRDIVCDSALFSNCLYLNKHKTPKICLGDNLLTNQLITDLVKMNKGIIVKRNLSSRELLNWSYVLSEIIRDEITQKRDSIWVAQREGRAKDGDDHTNPGIIKMLCLAGDEDSILERLKRLHIIPMAISYEYDPCDNIKAKELYLTEMNGGYQKSPDEDTHSVVTGINGFKGRVHIELGTNLDQVVKMPDPLPPKKDQFKLIASLIDEQIQTGYKLWPSNFIAYDILEQKNEMSQFYSVEDKLFFVDRMHQQIHRLHLDPGDTRPVQTYFLHAYANPVKNHLRHKPILA